ncbi:DoxX family protein [Cohnella suwonensis]|uniref:DoxX family protein n=1 Tax=Cohnella suwonensis TaxID=696072 RepID=A0ABW0LXA0_9BACL
MNKGLVIAGRAVLVVVGLFFMMNGFFKVSGAEQAVTAFQGYGYSDGFRVLIGIIELAGGLALIFRKTFFYAAALLTAVLIGAVGTHITNDEMAMLPMPIALIVILVVAFIRRRSLQQAYAR